MRVLVLISILFSSFAMAENTFRFQIPQPSEIKEFEDSSLGGGSSISDKTNTFTVINPSHYTGITYYTGYNKDGNYLNATFENENQNDYFIHPNIELIKYRQADSYPFLFEVNCTGSEKITKVVQDNIVIFDDNINGITCNTQIENNEYKEHLSTDSVIIFYWENF